MIHSLVEIAYLAAIVLFILALYWMNDPSRRGAACRPASRHGARDRWQRGAVPKSCITRGSSSRCSAAWSVGVPLSRVALTAVPQRTALVARVRRTRRRPRRHREVLHVVGEDPTELTGFRMTAIVVETLLGFLTLTGSLMAAGKLHGVSWIPQRPVIYPFQNFTTSACC